MIGNVISRLISLVLTLVILASGMWLELKLNEYRQEWNERKELSEMAQNSASKQRNNKDDKEPAAPDISALRANIPDIKAWITLKGSQIDYPVVQGEDNDQYLHRTVYGDYSNAGSVFIDAGCGFPFEEFNTVIYGHHMLSGSMFTGLKEFKNKEYFDKHKKFRLTTDKGDYDLWVAAFLHESADSDAYTTFFADGQEKDDFVTFINERAYYRSDVPIDRTSRLVTLSTCAYEWSDARYIVIGKMEKHKPAAAQHEKTMEAETEQTLPGRLFSKINPWFLAMTGINIIMLSVVIAPVISRITRQRK